MIEEFSLNVKRNVGILGWRGGRRPPREHQPHVRAVAFEAAERNMERPTRFSIMWSQRRRTFGSFLCVSLKSVDNTVLGVLCFFSMVGLQVPLNSLE